MSIISKHLIPAARPAMMSKALATVPQVSSKNASGKLAAVISWESHGKIEANSWVYSDRN